MLFQVFQLTALALRGPLPSGEKFSVTSDRVAIREDIVRGVLLCVQVFVRDPVFTQRSFFSETGVEMLPKPLLFLTALPVALFMFPGPQWRVSHPPEIFLI